MRTSWQILPQLQPYTVSPPGTACSSPYAGLIAAGWGAGCCASGWPVA
jgi:hypothetical protein